jgi:hypothetical protein
MDTDDEWISSSFIGDPANYRPEARFGISIQRDAVFVELKLEYRDLLNVEAN